MTTRERVEGRSESLNKTITEVMEFLDDNADRPGGWGAKLRPFLHEKLADLAEYWYKRGVRRGHIESHKECSSPTGQERLKSISSTVPLGAAR